ncbi:hypothetical protein QPM17_23550 [Marinobacter sp. TBZ242]|uniref:Preprotein translocase subunit SecD n=1 Tax=Marinobacter azerbaijanicus TaxID=3050455 RepID=A0ABT7IIU9_9GAMM|nr:hypothetical protein [Marinobacter sp. TBZ242]MDL0434110.1 hypothetical protein [Marinobacter sp. TBZ242]
MRAEDILPDHLNQIEQDGIVIRKGNVGAFLANAKCWSDPAATPQARDVAERDIVEALPVLRALGLFEVLSVRDPKLQRLIESHR